MNNEIENLLQDLDKQKIKIGLACNEIDKIKWEIRKINREAKP